MHQLSMTCHWSKNDSVRSVFFIEGRNLLNANYETGGILAENEVEGTGG